MSGGTPAKSPIAIVGIGCRFPGTQGPDEFWRRLCDGYDAVGPVPADRYDDPALARVGGGMGGFLADVDMFDPAFFGIAPREAPQVDPQQRLLMETAWQALADAGLPPGELAGSRTGVFIGQTAADYWRLQAGGSKIDLYAGLSGARSVLSGRLSYVFDLRGPSVSVDTACSSSLVAVHLASQSLRLGESTVALAGGVHLILAAEGASWLARAGMLSTEGRCRFGDAGGDGFVRGEGVGLVVLKTLERARADRDRIYALILGSAVNNDGQGSGYLITPAVAGQADVLRAACREAGVAARDVDYVEAHGTGTPVGDPVELEALAMVFGEGRPADRPLRTGSVKTNIGHAEAAAGIAGLIKTALCLRHGLVPASLHVRTPNPAVPWDSIPLVIQRELGPLPAREEPRLAGISSFGISGTNAHAVLTEAPPVAATTPDDGTPRLLVLSSHTRETLRELADSCVDYLGDPEVPPLRDICYSAAVRRAHHPHRLAVVAATPTEAAARLRAQRENGVQAAEVPARIAFVFPGQGGQWLGMGRELLAAAPDFAAALEECDRVVRAEAGWSVLDRITGAAESPDRTDVVQPTLWAVQVALATLWRSWGVQPDLVVGHSMGEVAAACVAGVLGVSDAAAVICRRSALAARLTGQGTMAAVALGEDQAALAIRGREDRLSIAASNSPASTVLSGQSEAIEEVLSELGARDVFCRRLDVAFAAHSSQVESIMDDVRRGLAGLSPRAGTVAMHSTVLDAPVDGAVLDGEYWARNLRARVRFGSAIRRILHNGPTVFVEISPHPTLASVIEECVEADGGPGHVITSLRRAEPELATLLTGLGTLYAQGQDVDWKRLYDGETRLVSLPHHRWRRERHWITSMATAPRHPLLGARDAGGDLVWEGDIDPTRNGYLRDHRVRGMAFFPGAAYVELVVAAVRELVGDRAVAVHDVGFSEVLPLADDGPWPRLRVRLRQEQDAEWRFEVASAPAGGADSWTSHVSGRVGVAQERPPEGDGVAAIQERCADHVTGAAFYARFAANGSQWGAAFQGVTEVWQGDREALVRVVCPASVAAARADHHFHPALLDVCGQALSAAAARADELQVVRSVHSGWIGGRPGTELFSHARTTSSPTGEATGDLRIFDAAGRTIAELTGVRLHGLGMHEPGPDSARGVPADRLYQLTWEPVPRPATPPVPPRSWLILGDAKGVGVQLRKRLENAGHHCVLVTPQGSPAPADRVVDLALPTAFHELLAEIQGTAPTDPPHIVHLWSLDAEPVETASDVDVERANLLSCSSVAALVRGFVALEANPGARLWLVTQGAHLVGPADVAVSPLQAPLWGLGRALALEHAELRPTLVDVELSEVDAVADSLCRELTTDDREDQVALRGSGRYRARLDRCPAVTDSGRRRRPGRTEVEIRTAYVGVGHTDVSRDPGLADVPPDAGVDCAGTITAVGEAVHGLKVGDEVIAMGRFGIAPSVVADAALVFRRPASLSLAEAATVPTAFLTAYHALCRLADVGRGDRVLVHAATGEVGMAAVQIARMAGADVYATAGSEENRALLRAMGIRHVADWHAPDFADRVLAATHGKGVDVVLNTLTGCADRNLELLAPYGRYLELAGEPGQLALRALARNISFHVVDVADMWQHQPARAASVMHEVLAHLDSGALAPLPSRTFPVADAAAAFRHRAQFGKVLLAFPPGERTESVVRGDATYLVTGALGGIGRTVVEWLIANGARHVCLVGRTARPDQDAITALRRTGAQILYQAADVADEVAMRAVLRGIEDRGWPSLRGVLHVAGVLDYGPIAELDPDRLAAVLRPKVQGSVVLHRLLRNTSLDFLVLFSSGSALLGSPMIGDYAAANAFLGGLAHHRRLRGEPALCVDWGIWEALGMTARATEHLRRPFSQFMGAFQAHEGIAALDLLLRGDLTQVAVLAMDWQQVSQAYQEAAHAPVLERLVPRRRPPVPASPIAAGDDPGESVRRYLTEQLAAVLGMSPQEVISQRPLNRIGLDSLMAVELKNRVRRDLGRTLPVASLLGRATLAELVAEMTRATDEPDEP